MARRFTFVFSAALFLAPTLCVAQARGGFHGGGHFTSPYGGRYGASFRHHSRYPGGYFLGDWPLFEDDYPLNGAPGEQGGPQVIIVQQVAAADPPVPKTPPLLIELQGNRYVRYGGAADPSAENVSATGARGSARDSKIAKLSTTDAYHSTPGEAAPRSAMTDSGPQNHASLAPTVLVYRDGHREAIPSYAIVGQVLYAHSADVGSYGMKNIKLSALDLTATIETNRENGINFVLPAGPNEVVTRP